ncbi:glycosyltransferase family 1 protein [Sagittula sp. S175]|uniref:glycosyltransferase family 1 protein n=1 Tax=Sagittula sp. S175 TaxID=3415129 RepID=UPI003C7B4E5D
MPTTTMTDVTLVTDPRFMGGTAQAFRTDVRAFLDAGLRVGLMFFHCGQFFRATDADNPALLELLDLPGIERAPQRTKALFLHNPQIFGAAQLASMDLRLQLPSAPRTFIVAHHPPFLGDGALCYDPLTTTRAINRRLMARSSLEWLPVSGLVRHQLNSFQPLLKLSPEDWPNSFDTEQWQPSRPRLTGPTLTIGRHGRADPAKWPDTAMAIAATLPSAPDIHVRVLGADPAFFAQKGVDTRNWEILPFGSEPPAAFLDSLDVFSYFHSAQWREAFGRTVAEAMMMQVPCLLDPELRPTFGPHALYPRPDDVPAILQQIRSAPLPHIDRATSASKWCRAQFDAQAAASRLGRLMTTPASRGSLSTDRSRDPLCAARKWIGFQRRLRRQEQLT